ncbi:hypothetical protein A2U01_0002920 [Trifolium medium]|uniref:Uncharacterized protein n=1 Tax=Trifolium medium TaxID=97028 RepID=A0A392M4X3_9FABA|nr:hypothetical protein [Trifolium medium]
MGRGATKRDIGLPNNSTLHYWGDSIQTSIRKKAVIPVEIEEPSRRNEQPLEEEMNDEALREELDLLEEIRTGASLREATLKQKIGARHDAKVN